MNIKTQINDFLITGQFTNNIDEFGNVNLLTVPLEENQQYIVFQLSNFKYKNDEIENLYDVNINEFKIKPTVRKQIVDQTILNEYNKVLS